MLWSPGFWSNHAVLRADAGSSAAAPLAQLSFSHGTEVVLQPVPISAAAAPGSALQAFVRQLDAAAAPANVTTCATIPEAQSSIAPSCVAAQVALKRHRMKTSGMLSWMLATCIRLLPWITSRTALCYGAGFGGGQ